jgi:hypothetical protein
MRSSTRFDVILQGGGRIMVAFREPNIRPDEVGSFQQAAQAHLDAGLPITAMAGVEKIIDNRPENERNLTVLITRDRSSGRYHLRYLTVHERGFERLLADPKCKVDPEKFDIVEALPESADRNVLCDECFPELRVVREYTAGPV